MLGFEFLSASNIHCITLVAVSLPQLSVIKKLLHTRNVVLNFKIFNSLCDVHMDSISLLYVDHMGDWAGVLDACWKV